MEKEAEKTVVSNYRQRLNELHTNGKIKAVGKMPESMQLIFENMAYEMYAYDNFPETMDERITKLLDDKKQLQDFLIAMLLELDSIIFDKNLDAIFGEDSDQVEDQDHIDYHNSIKAYEKEYGVNTDVMFINEEIPHIQSLNLNIHNRILISYQNAIPIRDTAGSRAFLSNSGQLKFVSKILYGNFSGFCL